MQTEWLLKNSFKLKHIFINLVVPRLSPGMRDLRLQYVGSSSLMRDQTWAACPGSAVLASGPPGLTLITREVALIKATESFSLVYSGGWKSEIAVLAALRRLQALWDPPGLSLASGSTAGPQHSRAAELQALPPASPAFLLVCVSESFLSS